MEIDGSRTDPKIIDLLHREAPEAFERIWTTSVSVDLARQIHEPQNLDFSQPWVGGVAWIGGAWTGNVRIAMPATLARRAALALWKCNPTEAQIDDALRELTNMTAGNLKSVLPGRNGLATPGTFKVVARCGVEDGFTDILMTWYEAFGEPLVLSVNGLHPSD